MSAIKAESRTYFRALGKRIEILRKEIGMTQAELARAIGVSQQTIYAIEIGARRVSVLMLAKLAPIFQISVEQLMGTSTPQLRTNRHPSPAGMRHAERFQQLSRTEQRFVKKIIDVLMEKKAPLAV
jgi:transcriptional regulator with XRE-family HTH domain